MPDYPLQTASKHERELRIDLATGAILAGVNLHADVAALDFDRLRTALQGLRFHAQDCP